MRITGGEGVDVASTRSARPSFRKDYRLLRQGGRLIMYGLAEVQTGEKARHPGPCEPGADAAGDDAVVEEPGGDEREQGGLRPQHAPGGTTRADIDRAIEPLIADLENGGLEPVVAEAFPFERAADAHRFIAERKNIGKVVLVPCRPIADKSVDSRSRSIGSLYERAIVETGKQAEFLFSSPSWSPSASSAPAPT